MKVCKQCNQEYIDDKKYCSACGNKLINKVLEHSYHQLSKEYQNIYGTWKVTTEGDCEGRTVKNLGIFIGNIDDIALHLADKNYYSLNFQKVEDIDKIKYSDKRNKVDIALDIESKTWDMTSEERVKAMQLLFNGRPVEIEKSNYYASFIIKRTLY